MKFLPCADLFSFTSEVRNKITSDVLALGFCSLLLQEQKVIIVGLLAQFLLVPQCGLEVTVRTEKPLLSVSQLSNGNFLSVTLEAAYSVPDTFLPTGPPQNYMACLQVPAVGEVRMGPGTVSWVLAAAAQVVVLHWGQTARLGLKLAVFFHAMICFFFLPSPALISWHLLLLMLKTEVLSFSCLSRRKSLCSSRTAS